MSSFFAGGARAWVATRLVVSLCVASLYVATSALTPAFASAADRQSPAGSLLQAWLALPGVEDIAWPYAYIYNAATTEAERRHKQQILAEFKHLLWRLEGDQYAALRATVEHWRDRVQQLHTFRLPGDWSPGWLLSHPNQAPPIARVAGLGVCRLPPVIQVWDSNGVHNIEWQSGLKLSSLLFDKQRIDGGGAPEVAVVRPRGEVEYFGIQAWNYVDTRLAPGTRVVAVLPLEGQAFGWIRDALARLLAHTPSGVACRQVSLQEHHGR